MLKPTLARLQQGHGPFRSRNLRRSAPDRYRGRPVIERDKCPVDCRDCAEACPTNAITIDNKGLRLDLGRCLFCTDCVDACPEQAIRYTQEFRLPPNRREDLVMTDNTLKLANALNGKARRLLGRSLNYDRSAPAAATDANPT